MKVAVYEVTKAESDWSGREHVAAMDRSVTTPTDRTGTAPSSERMLEEKTASNEYMGARQQICIHHMMWCMFGAAS